jgi:hypothetical protein
MTTHDNDDQQPVSTSRRSSLALTLKEDTMGTGADAEATQEKASTRNVHDDNDTLVIDWEGPDDPENPKKRVLGNYILWYTISYKTSQLAFSQEVDGSIHCFVFHLHQPSIVFNGCTGKRQHRTGVQHYQHRSHRNDHLNICAGVWCDNFFLRGRFDC